MSEHHWCCEAMALQVTHKCDTHSDLAECGDVVVIYTPEFDEYGIPYRDGGASMQTISFCPWCGTRLPESKRPRWFDELARLGFDDPFIQEIPEEFRTDTWWRSKADQQRLAAERDALP